MVDDYWVLSLFICQIVSLNNIYTLAQINHIIKTAKPD